MIVSDLVPVICGKALFYVIVKGPAAHPQEKQVNHTTQEKQGKTHPPETKKQKRAKHAPPPPPPRKPGKQKPAVATDELID